MIRAIYLPLRKRNQVDATRRSEENEFQESYFTKVDASGVSPQASGMPIGRATF
jgi:hypothetical protein|tara:strand:+ start:2775 stop:2936 length:162 start_codon:yes stop_codon:yes gene_type:complete